MMEERVNQLERVQLDIGRELKEIRKDQQKNEIEMVQTLHRIELQVAKLANSLERHIANVTILKTEQDLIKNRVQQVERTIAEVLSVLSFVKWMLTGLSGILLTAIAKAFGLI